jgi:FkbM family methyltransferase
VSRRRPSRARVVASRAKRRVRELRPRRVRAGVGAGLRIGLRHASADYSSGTNEVPVQEAFAGALRPGQVVFDVGSNVGFYSLLASRLVGPTGEVHAFEAIPEIAREVAANARRNRLGNVHVHAVAVTDVEGTVQLLRSRTPGGSTVSPDELPYDLTETFPVPAVTLDGFVRREGVRAPDFVKIDVEGAEHRVLAGMAGLLRDARPVVVCEVDDHSAERAHAKLDGVRDDLTGSGYSVQLLENSYTSGPSTVLHVVATPD